MPAGLAAFAAQLRLTGAKCDEAAAAGVMAELQSALTSAARPLAAEVRGGLRSYMPARYAGVLSGDLDITSTETRSGSTVRAEFRARSLRKKRELARLNAGRLNHPLWGDRQHWYSQTARVTAGFFTRPIRRAAPQIKQQLADALNRVADKVAE